MYLKIIKSDTQIEIYRYENEPIQNKARISRRDSRPRHSRPPVRTFANARRARKAFIRLVRSNLTGESSPAFLTLTMRDIVSVSLAYSALKFFFTDFRHFLGKDIRYIAVPEFQKRGAVHFHILVWGVPSEVIEYEKDSRCIQNLWALGFVDIVPTDGNPRLAGYLGKYMSKSLLDSSLGFSKAYSCSRNVLRPVSYSSVGSLTLPDSVFDGDNIVLTEREYEVPWLGACHYQLIVKKS